MNGKYPGTTNIFVMSWVLLLVSTLYAAGGSATCTGGHRLCNGFQGGCAAVKGGLSTNSDGSVTCTVATARRSSVVRNFTMATGRQRNQTDTEPATCYSDGSEDGDQICEGFAAACDELKCGSSTESDGGLTCSC